MFGQFHSVSRRHLQRYIDEFCYRYNLRNADPSRSVRPDRQPGVGSGPMSMKPLESHRRLCTLDHPLEIGDIDVSVLRPVRIESQQFLLKQMGMFYGIGACITAGG